MIKKSRVLIILFCFINFNKTYCQNKNISFSINGYIKYLPSHLNYNLEPSTWVSPLLTQSQTSHLIHNRLNMRGYLGNNFTLGVELRNRVMFGDLQIIQRDQGWVDMSFYVFEKPKFIFHSMVDRLWLKYQKNKLEINIGRQRVNWGINTIWNSNDLFNAYNFVDFDYVERPGSDVVRLIYTGDNLSSVELVFMPTNTGRNILAGMYKFNKLSYDFQIIVADYFNDFVIGGGWAGNILKAGFKGELSYFLNKHVDNALSLSTSIDYSFRSGFYLLGSYLYNSQGNDSPGFLNLINITDNVLSPRNLMPSKNSYLFQLSKPISPPVNTSFTIMYGGGINLLYLSPSISYDVNSRIDLNLISQIFFLENTKRLENLMRSVYLQIKYSF